MFYVDEDILNCIALHCIAINTQTQTRTYTDTHTEDQCEEAMHAGIPCPVLTIAGHFACIFFTFLKYVTSI